MFGNSFLQKRESGDRRSGQWKSVQSRRWFMVSKPRPRWQWIGRGAMCSRRLWGGLVMVSPLMGGRLRCLSVRLKRSRATSPGRKAKPMPEQSAARRPLRRIVPTHRGRERNLTRLWPGISGWRVNRPRAVLCHPWSLPRLDPPRQCPWRSPQPHTRALNFGRIVSRLCPGLRRRKVGSGVSSHKAPACRPMHALTPPGKGNPRGPGCMRIQTSFPTSRRKRRPPRSPQPKVSRCEAPQPCRPLGNVSRGLLRMARTP